MALTVGIDHHVPSQVCDLSGAQACLGGEQDHDRVLQRVSRAAGEDNQVTNIVGGKYFRLLAGHANNK
jgi:hypothetical protein